MLLGKTFEGKELVLDLNRLVETRLLLQANSGGGKSWALRRILEQTHGKIQQIVIDVEDEFPTLREHFDYVLAGSPGSEVPADTKSAALLARRLLELNVSAIVGIYELKAHDRIRFVRLFLDALVNAPRELWHPVLVVIDEAHIFCPQHGEAESASAVIDLMTRGRKRGFCGILATQRISKLHKDAAAEANNKLIGRSALDVDMKRASDELGFSSRDDQAQLRTLKPGEFFSFGPAISDTVTKVRVGEIKTTHPRAGQHAAPPPPPKEKVRAILGKLADLPRAAAEEARSVAELQGRVRELEYQLKRVQPAVDPEAVKKAFTSGKEAGIAEAEKYFLNVHRIWASRFAEISNLVRNDLPPLGKVMSDNRVPSEEIHVQQNKHPIPIMDVKNKSAFVVPKAERLILNILGQYPHGRSKIQIALMAGYAHKGGAFSNAISSLRSQGLIEGGNELLKMTSAGGNAMGNTFEILPVGVDLLRHWQNNVGKAEREILDVLFEVYPQPLSKSEIAEATPSKYQANGGSFNNAVCRLRTLELIKGRREMVLSEELVNS